MSKSFKYLISTLTFLFASFLLLQYYFSTTLPLSASNAGWNSMSISSTADYIATLNRWASESEQFEGKISLVNLEGQVLQIDRKNEVSKVLFKEDQKYLQEKALPNSLNSIYTASGLLEENESFPDVIVCKAECIDVSAWFLLGDYLPQLKVPTNFSGYDSLKLGSIVTDIRLDSYFLRAWAKDVTFPTKIVHYSDDGVKQYTNKDRIFVTGSRYTPAGEDNCVGYYDHKSMIKEDVEFTWFCYNEKFHLFSGDSKTAKLVKVVTNSVKLRVPKHKDILDSLSTSQLSFLQEISGVNPTWFTRHSDSYT